MFDLGNMSRVAALAGSLILSGCGEQKAESASTSFDLLCSVTAIDDELTRHPNGGFPVTYPQIGDQVRMRLDTSSRQACFGNCGKIYSSSGAENNDRFSVTEREIIVNFTDTFAGRELPANYSNEYFLGTNFWVNRLDGTAIMQVRYRPVPNERELTGGALQLLTVRAQCKKEAFSGFPKAKI